MHFNDINDDLALPKKPFKVIACLAIHGRLPLLRQTITRLLEKNGCYKVICAGDSSEEKNLCHEVGAVWVYHRNKPLGAKWNAAFKKAKEFEPDAVLYVGSSDWISSDWIPTLEPYVKEYDFVGTPGCYFLDIGKTMRLCNWRGYKGERETETIGIGRMLSSRLMDAMKWEPFDGALDNSLDRSMKDNVMKVGVPDFMFRGFIKSLSISTDKWMNKHQFIHHWDNLLPSEKIVDVDGFLKEFPEAYQIFK